MSGIRVWVHNFSNKFCQDFFSLLEGIRKILGIAETAIAGKRFQIFEEAINARRVSIASDLSNASDANFAMHVIGVDELADYAVRFPSHGASNPVEEIYSYTKQDKIRRNFGAGIWEIHHLVERRISRALGITTNTVYDTSPAINLPTRINGGYKSMASDELIRYREKFGRDPVTHRGPNGIKEAIDGIFDGNQWANEVTLAPAQQQQLLNELRVLYAQDARFAHLKLWPPTRDWLKRQLPTMTIPN